MKCPVCLQPDLVMSDRQGIEIDYCPQCRGVWLDRGELDKIIERSAAQAPAAPPQQQQQQPYVPQNPPGQQPVYGQQQHYKKYDDDYHGGYGHKKKRKGFLGDIFDFD
ncbi:MAG TPA: zf-TFIIB domain-containing protein [Longimicrobium sp.]|nr:zf-TFIIB domain-containing protein [Longimicrobium sp.]